MRVKRLIVKNSGPLHNLDIKFSPITLIVGDNERGKTRLMNWIAKGLFEKPSITTQGEDWSDQIGGNQPIQINADPFYKIYDGKRMENLLFVRETDLLFKFKNQSSEVSLQEFWNNQIHSVLYGKDSVSEELQKSFLRSMGVGSSAKNSWLSNLHDSLFALKKKIDGLLPEFELLQNKENSLIELNQSLGKIDEQEQYIESKEELYFLVDKVKLGKKYLQFCDKVEAVYQEEELAKDAQNKELQSQEELRINEELLCDIEDNIADLKITVFRLQDEEKMVQEDPFRSLQTSLGETILNFLIGIGMIASGLFMAYHSRTAPNFNYIKLFSLLFFVAGFLFLATTLCKELFAQYLAKQEKGSFFHEKMVEKARNAFQKKFQELEEQEQRYRSIIEECKEIRKQMKNNKLQGDVLKKTQRYNRELILELEKLSHQVFQAFETDNPDDVKYEIEKIEHSINTNHSDFDFEDLRTVRSEKNDLLEQQGKFSKDYERGKSKIIGSIRTLIDEIKATQNIAAVEYFYPEIMELDIRNISQIDSLIDSIDLLLDRTSKDRYRAEKLVEIYQNSEYNEESFLVKALNMPFFESLIQNMFGGRYKTFRAEFDKKNNVRIFAETGHAEFYPLEELSSSACAQFWLILRLTIAKLIIGSEKGIILLDDPFSSFDSLRKQNFVDLLNTFAHNGWQIVCTLTNDDALFHNFQNVFGSALQIIDLNQD